MNYNYSRYMDLPKAYAAKDYEDEIYKRWESSGLFAPQIKLFKKPFVISMPPPNATGTLHLGHAIMLALEDIMIRYHRMRGDPALWLPGTDHASIATQNKVEQMLSKEGKTRYDLGRERFLERVHEFVKNSQDVIRKQIRKMGSSCDWSRERYTLDQGLSLAVQEIFVKMYKDGLIYRGNRIVNWCPRCASTLADDEVEYVERSTKLYVFKYDKNFPFEIATTRPETKLGDTAVAVHPEDKRYKKYIGKKFTVEFAGTGPREIKIIADSLIDSEFGTGAVGVTPSHSQIDFEIAQRHNLSLISVIDENGKITHEHALYAGIDVLSAREKIIEYLKQQNLLRNISDIIHNLSICYRCATPIEPLVSKQWFVDVNKKFRRFGLSLKKKSLKEIAIEVVRRKKIKILPERFEKTYFHWMTNLRDWCISRQIWFGHRIPVWYSRKSGIRDQRSDIDEKIYVGLEPPKDDGWIQDPDTLDTWFSSGLWTFSTLGWPEKTKDLKYFHPTSVLETGYDILFFWIARMILMTIYALRGIPFKTVYLHGLVRTRTGEKMSKSKPETCIDPLDMIEKYGADALRLSMVVGAGPGNDIRLYEEKIAGYRNFVNKIWNASRFALMNISESDKYAHLQKSHVKSLADKWILTRTQNLIREVTDDIENYRFSEAGTRIYDFTWSGYCDWYLEISKGEHKNPAVLVYVLKTILKLLHPFTPFITEVIWGHLGQKSMLIGESWPKFAKKWVFAEDEKDMQIVIDAVSAIRKMRHENEVEPGRKIHAIIFGAIRQIKLIKAKLDAVKRLAGLETLELVVERAALTASKVPESISEYLSSGIEIYLPLRDLIDVEKEKIRLRRALEEVKAYISRIEKQLKTPAFRKKAPAELIQAEEEKLALQNEKLAKLGKKLNMLGN